MTIQAKLFDGRVLNFPDGTDPTVIQSTVKSMLQPQQPVAATFAEALPQNQSAIIPPSGEVSTIAPQPTEINPEEKLKREQNLQALKGIPEAALTVASGAVAEPVAGLAGIVGGILPGEEGQAAKFVEGTREALTVKPFTGSGEVALGKLGEAAAPVGEAISATEKALGDFAFDLTGSATVAAGAASLPTLVGELLGLKGLKRITKGTRLIDDAGRPTKVLRKALRKQGLDFDTLSPEAKKLIPDVSDRAAFNPIKTDAENVLKEQIKSGARDDSLAGLMVKGGEVVVNKAEAEAMKQGFTPGFVRTTSTSSRATKIKARQMADIKKKALASERFAINHRASDVVGDSVTERILYIRDAADTARKELNQIAKDVLPGKKVDNGSLLSTIETSLDDLDVSLAPDKDGVSRAEFKGSLISKDPSSKKAINDLLDLMSEGDTTNALRMHNLKRQLDIMIDFKKLSPLKLTPPGKKVLKKVRRSLNETIREESASYARVNDVLSESLTALGDLDDAVGKVDIFGRGANKALGTRMRALMSNQTGRITIENAVDQLESTTKNLGGKFDDNIKDLTMFSNGLDKKFGASADTGFAGQIGQEIGRAATSSPKATAVNLVGKAIGAGVEKIRGVNNFNSFEALNNILK